MIGDKQSVFIIAEAGVNHNGDLEIAKDLIEKAAKAGADAVKFQTFIPEKLVSRYAQKAEYQKVTTGQQDTQLEMLRKLQLKREYYEILKAEAEKRNILFISTDQDFLLYGIVSFMIYRIRKYISFKLIVITTFCCLCIVIPWLIRNYYLSGYLIYPFPSVDIFNPIWKIPIKDLITEKQLVSSYAWIQKYDINFDKLQFITKLKIWWGLLSLFRKIILINC